MEYRAYLLTKDGHITQRVDLACADEDEAKQQAEQLAESQDVELWLGARKVAVLRHAVS